MAIFVFVKHSTKQIYIQATNETDKKKKLLKHDGFCFNRMPQRGKRSPIRLGAPPAPPVATSASEPVKQIEV